jgi:hypothetical protein
MNTGNSKGRGGKKSVLELHQNSNKRCNGMYISGNL